MPTGQRLGEKRQRPEGARDPDAFPGRAQIQPHPPGEPGRAGAEARVPSAAGVERADQLEQARGGGVEMRRQLGDLVAKSVEFGDAMRSGNGGRQVDLHVESLRLLRQLYTLGFELSRSAQDERRSDEEWFLLGPHAVRAAAAACGPLGRLLPRPAVA